MVAEYIMSKTPNLRECLAYGWDRVKRHPVFHIGGSSIVGAVAILTGGVLLGPMIAGYFMAEEQVDADACPRPTDVFAGFRRNPGATIIVSLLYAAASTVLLIALGLAAFAANLASQDVAVWVLAIGGLLLLLAGLASLPFFLHVVYRAGVRGEADAFASIRQAWEDVRPCFGAWMFASMVLLGIGLSGMCFCCLGQVVTLPVAYAGLFRLSGQIAR